MTSLLSAVEADFSTDFNILYASQGVHVLMPGSFARTCGSTLSARCGTKFANVQVRAERWDGRPPSSMGWEDVDELPFEELPGGGLLMLGGFDESDVGLDVEGLGRARVLVLARGRHRYNHWDEEDGLPPEEWLFQFFPDPEMQDALAGDPRRLAGPAPHGSQPTTGWLAALRAWEQTGWTHYLSGRPGFYQLRLALGTSATDGLTCEGLARAALRFSRSGAIDEPDVNGDPLLVPLIPELLTAVTSTQLFAELRKGEIASLSALASLADLSELRVVGDFIDALQRIGLLLPVQRRGVEVLVPNACPGLVWDLADVTEEERAAIRLSIGEEFSTVAVDLRRVLWWAPKRRFATTPRRISTRLAVTPRQVLGALDLLRETGEISCSPALVSNADTSAEASELRGRLEDTILHVAVRDGVPA